jgi:dolichol-phosphate mannosyltransferase
MYDISLIIPFLNEEENLYDLLLQLNEYSRMQAFSIEAIFVDDGSKDASVQVIKKFESDVPLKLVRLSKNFGSHAAVSAGITCVEGRYTMFFSADLQEPFSMIGAMYTKAQEGYEIVIARKANVQVSFSERLFSNAYTALVRKFAVTEYPKGGANNIMFSEKVRKILCENVETNSSVHLQIINMGFKKATMDFSLNLRNKGKSKWTFSKRIKLFIDSFMAFSYMPIRAISVMGIILFVAGLIYALWIIIAKVTGIVEFSAGFPTMISIILIGFGLTNFALGVAAEYLWRTLDAARDRPVYIIDTIETLPGRGKG